MGVAAWLAVVGLALGWGGLAVADADVSLGAAPLAGSWGWHAGRGLLAAVAVGAATVAWGPTGARRLPWRALPPVTALAATAWATALAAGDGWSRLTRPLATRHEYEPFAATLGDGAALAGFLHHHTEALASYPVHVQGHPPGPVALAWALDRVGLGGAGWLAALALAGWGVAAAVALVAARSVAGEGAARRAAPALAVLPAAIWAGTSLDALFAAVGGCACALAVVAVSRSPAPTALAAGAGFGVALLLTYGVVPLLAVPAAALASWWRRDGPGAGRLLRLAGLAGLGALVVLAAAAAAGFWWPEGLAATHARYWAGIGGRRPGWYLTVAGNPGALALATGPAVAAGLATLPGTTLAARWHRRRAAVLPAAALVAVLAADLSQLSRGEVERIWLPFVPWLALAAPGDRRGWLAVQVVLALALQSALRSPW